MVPVRVALLQMAAHHTDQAANLAKGEAFCRQAADLGADVALFPEMWNTGYQFFDRTQAGAREVWESLAIDRDSSFVTHFRQLAQELDMAIALTYLERWAGPPRNSVSLIDRQGQILMTYAKVHTCDFGAEAALTAGDDFYVHTLDTAGGPVDVGTMICFDREFPETARILMLKGAELILTPNACTLEANRIGQFKARAYENMVGVAMANYASPDCNGHSVAFDAVAFSKTEETLDTCLVQADESEGVFVADFDMDRLRDYREREVWGNAFRKVSRYGLLTSPQVRPPFVRPEARR